MESRGGGGGSLEHGVLCVYTTLSFGQVKVPCYIIELGSSKFHGSTAVFRSIL